MFRCSNTEESVCCVIEGILFFRRRSLTCDKLYVDYVTSVNIVQPCPCFLQMLIDINPMKLLHPRDLNALDTSLSRRSIAVRQHGRRPAPRRLHASPHPHPERSPRPSPESGTRDALQRPETAHQKARNVGAGDASSGRVARRRLRSRCRDSSAVGSPSAPRCRLERRHRHPSKRYHPVQAQNDQANGN